ncbi:MAG: hypothetical protein ACFB0B_19755 [Thermonemataceae bacterium]
MRILILFFCLNSLLSEALGQLVEETHLYIDIPKRTEITFDVLPFEQEGLMIFGTFDKLDGSYDQEDLYYFTKYDLALEELWRKEYALDNQWVFQQYFRDQTDLYNLFYNYSEKAVGILQTNIKKGEMTWRQSSYPADIEISDFKVFGKNAFIFGKVRGSSSILDFSFFDDQIKVVPALYDTKRSIKDIHIDFQNYTAYFLIKNRDKGQCQYIFKSFLSNGKLLKEGSIQVLDNKNLIDPRYTILNNKRALVVGTFGNNSNSFAEGLAIASIDEKKEKHRLQYTPFYTFDNYFAYLKPKQQERMEEKMRKRLKQKKGWIVNQRFLLQPPIVTDWGMIVLAEGYTPEYSGYNNSLVRVNINTRVRREAASGLLGYRFRNVIVAAFNQQGKLIWDNAAALNSELITSIDFQAVPKLHNNRLTLLQAFSDGYGLKVMEQDSCIYETEEAPYLKEFKNYEDEEVLDEQKVRLENYGAEDWYGEYFLLWGIRFKNPKNTFSNERVFQISKVKFEPPAETVEEN